MRLGIDFGTTHTVVALVDRGNYPVVAFEWGDAVPSVIAVRDHDGSIRYGQDAALVSGEPGWSFLRSFKRLMGDAGPLTDVAVGPHHFLLSDLLAGYFGQLRDDLVHRSNAGLRAGEVIEAAVSVPANSSNDQR